MKENRMYVHIVENRIKFLCWNSISIFNRNPSTFEAEIFVLKLLMTQN